MLTPFEYHPLPVGGKQDECLIIPPLRRWTQGSHDLDQEQLDKLLDARRYKAECDIPRFRTYLEMQEELHPTTVLEGTKRVNKDPTVADLLQARKDQQDADFRDAIMASKVPKPEQKLPHPTITAVVQDILDKVNRGWESNEFAMSSLKTLAEIRKTFPEVRHDRELVWMMDSIELGLRRGPVIPQAAPPIVPPVVPPVPPAPVVPPAPTHRLSPDAPPFFPEDDEQKETQPAPDPIESDRERLRFINPKSGRLIHPGKITHQQLMAEGLMDQHGYQL